MAFLHNHEKVPYNIYKKDIYNFFLATSFKLYPSTFFSGVDTIKVALFDVARLQLVNFKLNRYKCKKQIFMSLEYNNSIIVNNRYRKEYNLVDFEGFKLRLGGRLTRKQRASSF